LRGSVAFVVAGAALAGCTAKGYLLVRDPPRALEVEELIRAAPLAAGQNIRPTELRRADNMSVHLVRIRDREQPHVHTRYDLAVVLVRGTGTLWLAGKPLPMREGDVAVIPKETAHFFVNEGREPASALVVFSPAFDGPDQRPVE
jgi:quercetin dioxygenase-like cupin family protein